MHLILTLLLAFLITFAPVAPGEAGIGYGMQTLQGEEPHEDGHAHGAWRGGQAAGATLSADCAPVVGHCVTEMAPPAGDVFPADFTVAADLTVHPDQLGQGIVLTAEPPPPRT